MRPILPIDYPDKELVKKSHGRTPKIGNPGYLTNKKYMRRLWNSDTEEWDYVYYESTGNDKVRWDSGSSWEKYIDPKTNKTTKRRVRSLELPEHIILSTDSRGLDHKDRGDEVEPGYVVKFFHPHLGNERIGYYLGKHPENGKEMVHFIQGNKTYQFYVDRLDGKKLTTKSHLKHRRITDKERDSYLSSAKIDPNSYTGEYRNHKTTKAKRNQVKEQKQDRSIFLIERRHELINEFFGDENLDPADPNNYSGLNAFMEDQGKRLLTKLSSSTGKSLLFHNKEMWNIHKSLLTEKFVAEMGNQLYRIKNRRGTRIKVTKDGDTKNFIGSTLTGKIMGLNADGSFNKEEYVQYLEQKGYHYSRRIGKDLTFAQNLPVHLHKNISIINQVKKEVRKSNSEPTPKELVKGYFNYITQVFHRGIEKAKERMINVGKEAVHELSEEDQKKERARLEKISKDNQKKLDLYFSMTEEEIESEIDYIIKRSLGQSTREFDGDKIDHNKNGNNGAVLDISSKKAEALHNLLDAYVMPEYVDQFIESSNSTDELVNGSTLPDEVILSLSRVPAEVKADFLSMLEENGPLY